MTLSLCKSRSPVFDLFFDLEENSEEEVTETMAETMEEYMSKNRADYGSGAIPTKTSADAKVANQEMTECSQKYYNGTFKARSTKTFDGLAAIQAQLNNIGREIKKVDEKVYAAQSNNSEILPKEYYKPFVSRMETIDGRSLSKFMSKSAKRHEGSYGPQFLEAYSYGALHIDNSIP
nr:hypothetical protein [Tanacetum cinerariifolium]